MSTPTMYTNPSAFRLGDLERNILRSRRLAAVCRLVKDDHEAELHTLWMDILLDEWARRQSAA